MENASAIDLYDDDFLYLNKGNQPLRVLILEDTPSDAALLSLELKKIKEPFHAEVAANKSEFLSTLDSFKPHIILSDYNLPQYTGMEALMYTRAKNPYIPFIICTGSINEETAVACIKAGADDYVLKDSMGRLSSAVENALQAKTTVIEKERTTMELKASEENFRALAENAPDNIYKLDRRGHILYVSSEVDGKAREEVLGTPIYHFISPKNIEHLKDAVGRVFETGTSQSVVIKGNPNDPEAQWYLCRLGPVMIENAVDSVVFIPGNITSRIKAELETKDLNQRLQHLTRHLENVRDEEKERIAQEIHDQLGQELTGNKLGLYWIKQQLVRDGGPEDMDKVLEKIDYLVDLTTTTIQTVRRIALELRPVVLDNMGLVAALEWHVENYNEQHETECNFVHHIDDLTFDKEFNTNVYRIVQEALTNIDRHAKATIVDIELFSEDGRLHLIIADNGVGIDLEKANKSKSLGLFGMKERVKAWGGIVDIESGRETGQGTKLRFIFDLDTVRSKSVNTEL